MQNKSLNLRVDKIIYQQIQATAKQQHTTQSQILRDAIQLYLKPIQTVNTDLVTVLKAQIQDLQQERDNLQRIVNYYAQPWYKRLFQRPQLKEKN